MDLQILPTHRLPQNIVLYKTHFHIFCDPASPEHCFGGTRRGKPVPAHDFLKVDCTVCHPDDRALLNRGPFSLFFRGKYRRKLLT